MHSSLSQHVNTNNILIAERYGFGKGISTEDAALKLANSVFKSINQKLNGKEFSVIWQRLWIVCIMKFI